MQTKIVATLALLIVAVFSIGTVSAAPQLVGAGPVIFGYNSEDLAAQNAITYDDVVFGVGVEKFNVGEEEKLAIEKLNIVNIGVQDSYLNVPRQHVPVGSSYNALTDDAMRALFAPYIA